MAGGGAVVIHAAARVLDMDLQTALIAFVADAVSNGLRANGMGREEDQGHAAAMSKISPSHRLCMHWPRWGKLVCEATRRCLEQWSHSKHETKAGKWGRPSSPVDKPWVRPSLHTVDPTPITTPTHREAGLEDGWIGEGFGDSVGGLLVPLSTDRDADRGGRGAGEDEGLDSP